MKLDTEYIEKLADLLLVKGLSEISVEEGNQSVTVKRELCGNYVVPQVQSTVTEPQAVAKPENNSKGKPITAPMIGTFYRSASNGSEPFAEVGKEISKGDVVCIIEAMKLMNEIESEYSGKIIEICVEDGQPVEFGQVLMYVE